MALETALRHAGHTALEVMLHHGRWMLWNSFLALVPAALAVVLFRRDARTGAAWWLGVATFVAFLPNAPYVLSDVIHFLDDVRQSSTTHDLRLTFVVAPIYLAFMLVGFGSYVWCLQRVRAFVAARHGGPSATGAVYALHALSSVGVFLGRFWRFNSWDLVTAPDSLAYRLDDLMHRWPVAMIGLTFVSLVVLTNLVELLVDGVRFRRQRRRLML